MASVAMARPAGVQERIGRFYRDHPEGSVRTFLARHEEGEVVFEARVFRSAEEAALGVYTSGWARGMDGGVEPCETAAVGRALANLGYAPGAGEHDVPGAAKPDRRPSRSTHEEEEAHELDALLDWIREAGPRVPDDAEILVHGKVRRLKRYVRENWSAIKEQPRTARLVVEAIQRATETEAAREAA